MRKDVCEGRSINNGVLSLAVLYHIVGKVEEIQAMIIVSWKRADKEHRIRFEGTLLWSVPILGTKKKRANSREERHCYGHAL